MPKGILCLPRAHLVCVLFCLMHMMPHRMEGGGCVSWDDLQVPEVQVTQGKEEVQWRKQTEPTVTYPPEVPGFGRDIRDRSVRAVIESDMEHPICEIYRKKLEAKFEEVFQFKPHTEMNEFPGLRGEHGTCKIGLKENPQPETVQPYTGAWVYVQQRLRR